MDKNHTKEIIFLVEDEPEGGYIAKAIGESIFTQADTLQELRELIKDAVHCHYPESTYDIIFDYYFTRLKLKFKIFQIIKLRKFYQPPKSQSLGIFR